MNLNPTTNHKLPQASIFYESIFQKTSHDERKSDEFWQEFFSSPPDVSRLRGILDKLSPSQLFSMQVQLREFFSKCIEFMSEQQTTRQETSFVTLTVFFTSILSKSFANPSSDIIGLLADLNNADKTFSKFVFALDSMIRCSEYEMNLRVKALQLALCITSSSYYTTFTTYFLHQDFFPSLVKFILDTEDLTYVDDALYLLGLLLNCNKFELRNPYQHRLEHFKDGPLLDKLVSCIGKDCAYMRDEYVNTQDDTPRSWSISGTISNFTGALLTSKSTARKILHDRETFFQTSPSIRAITLMPLYDFVRANRHFSCVFIAQQARNNTSRCFADFLSFSSYVFQHAYRSSRATHYAYAILFILRLLVENETSMQLLYSNELKCFVRLCRQRLPYLPVHSSDQVFISWIMDIIIDLINHNMRRKLDTQLYTLSLGIALRIVDYLGKMSYRLTYHWSELWRSLFSLTKFLTHYSVSIRQRDNYHEVLDTMIRLLGLSVATGECFLPDAASYDDLFYKIVQTGEVFKQFGENYHDDFQESANHNSKESGERRRLVSTLKILTGISQYYATQLEGNSSKGAHLSSKKVIAVIKQGYDSLSLQNMHNLNEWKRFRETDHQVCLKKLRRFVVEDCKKYVQKYS